MVLNCGVGEDLRVPWTARRSNQSILKEISPEYSLEGLILKLQYFGLLMRRTNLSEKTLSLGRIEGGKRQQEIWEKDQWFQIHLELILNIHWKNWCWSWNSSTMVTWCKELTHWKRPWCWERLNAGGKGDDRGWDGWMASLTPWTWVWVNSRSW